MLELILFFIILLSFTYFSGLFFCSVCFNSNLNDLDFFETSLIGIFFLTYITFIIHFFVPINEITNLILALVFFLYSLLFNREKILIDLKKLNIFIIIFFILVIIMTIKYKVNEDFVFYHLPYMVNFTSEKIIFGLANIQPHFAWNSSWLNFSSSLFLPVMKLKGILLSNSVLYFIILSLFIKKIIQNKNNSEYSFFFLISILYYIIVKYSRISAHGFDLPANVFVLISFYYFLKIFEFKFKNCEKELILFLLFSVLSISIKLNTLPIIFLIFVVFIKLISEKHKFKYLKIPLLISTSFIILWLIQQFIYSSCLVVFLEFTCFESVSWFSPSLHEAINSITGVINKSYWQYQGELSEIEYAKNFNWVSTWIQRNKIEILEHLFAIILPIIILILINLKYLNKEKKKFFKKENNLNIFILIFIFIGLSLWFLKSPVYRFGMPYIFLSISFLIYVISINLFGNFFSRKNIIIILCFCIIFNFTKNLVRINNSNNENSIWPNVLNIKYSSKEINGYNINYPDSDIVSTQHNLCWSIPFLCDINKGKSIKIERIKNYLFIKK